MLLSKQIKFTSVFKRQLLIGFLIGAFLSFVIIFLEPFDTDNFKSNNKTILLLGYGVLMMVTISVQGYYEQKYYRKTNKVWTIFNETISITTFFIISGTILYLYNCFFVNNLDYSIASHLNFYKNIVIVFVPIILPLILLLRNKLGEFVIPTSSDLITIVGKNKKEVLKINKNQILFIKADENYIHINYTNKNQLQTKTFRETLTGINKQFPFLVKCHKSYLINMDSVKDVIGNSQNAKISFHNIDLKIPLSKSFYPKITDLISN